MDPIESKQAKWFVVLHAEVSKMEGRTAKTTNLVIGGTENPVDSDWIELDKKVSCNQNL